MTPLPHLDYLGFRLLSPAPVLRPYIRNYWLVQSHSKLVFQHEEFLHPEGGFGMIFNFGDNFSFDGQLIQKKYLLDGANSKSRRMQFQGNVEAIGIRFYTGGAYPFLKIPLYKLADEFLLLDDLALNLIDSLYESIINTSDILEKIRLLEKWLIQRLHNSDTTLSGLITPSLRLLHNTEEDRSIKKIADDLYISQRQLERVFKTQVGMTPKQYARIRRIEEARHFLKNQSVNRGTIGIAPGYYDQSHFIREFKAQVGMTPLQYKERHLQRLAMQSNSK